MFTLIFMTEDFDLVTEEFNSLEDAEEFRERFSDLPPVDYNSDDGFWRLGYEPKNILISGKVVSRHT